MNCSPSCPLASTFTVPLLPLRLHFNMLMEVSRFSKPTGTPGTSLLLILPPPLLGLPNLWHLFSTWLRQTKGPKLQTYHFLSNCLPAPFLPPPKTLKTFVTLSRAQKLWTVRFSGPGWPNKVIHHLRVQGLFLMPLKMSGMLFSTIVGMQLSWSYEPSYEIWWPDEFLINSPILILG